MNLFDLLDTFPDQLACITHLEDIRWNGEPECPYCHSKDVQRKKENKLIGRWNCHECTSSFNVLSGTIFEKTRVPLQKWFAAISLVVNAKKSLSSHQLSRDLRLNQKTAWYILQRIRKAMGKKDTLLKGIVEADETYVGGRPRKENKKEDRSHHRGNRGPKTAVLGAVERGGKVKTMMAKRVDGETLVKFIRSAVKPEGTTLMTDEFGGYNELEPLYEHQVINHSRVFAIGETHTNTIEGFWSLVKRAWYGTHHHYTKKYMPLYLNEASWKYNRRKDPNAFDTILRGLFG